MAISKKVQDQIVQYQQLEGQIEALFLQKTQISSQMAEVRGAMEALENAGKDTTVYQAAGNILVKRSGVKEMTNDLTSRLELLEVRQKAVEKQETALRERYTALQKEISDALSNAQMG